MQISLADDSAKHCQTNDTLSSSNDVEILVPDPRAHAQNSPQATESPNDEPTCPAVQSTQVTETGELTKPWIHYYDS